MKLIKVLNIFLFIFNCLFFFISRSDTHTESLRTSQCKVQLRFRLRVRRSERVRKDDSSSDSDDEDTSGIGELEPFSWPFIENVHGKESNGTVEAVVTGKELFQAVSRRLKRVLLQDTPQEEMNANNEGEAAYSTTAFPFLLYRTSPSGTGCDVEGCTRGRTCDGHVMFPDDEALDHLTDTQVVCIDISSVFQYEV